MKVKTLANGLELRHNGDGFTLLFTPADGKGGALLNMTQIANERGLIVKSKMLQVMGESVDEEFKHINIERTIESLHEIRRINERLQENVGKNGTTWHQHETVDDKIHDLLTELGD